MIQDVSHLQPHSGDVPMLLQHAVDEAARLLGADGAIVYLLDPNGARLRWAHDAGISNDTERGWVRELEMPLGVGMFGRATQERRVLITGDYLPDPKFAHGADPDRVAREVGIRSMVVAPMDAAAGPLGALGAYATRADAFGESDAALIKALADHAALAIQNARLIEQLARSQVELERRAVSQHALGEIAARIAAIHDPAQVLQRVVDESKRLLASDSAHLALIADGGRHLTVEVVAGHTDAETRAWLKTLESPLDRGMNGLAASRGELVRTVDCRIDARIPHREEDQEVARRLGLTGMAVAPLRAAEGAVIGTLAISYRKPRDVTDAEAHLLQSLADHAAVAITNSRLIEQLARSEVELRRIADELRSSEARYRFLLERSPDLIWSTDSEGNITFMSDSLERMTGWRPDEVAGQHYSLLLDPQSAEEASGSWVAAAQQPRREQRLRLHLVHRDGRRIPAEMHGVGKHVDGIFAGAHGSVRDMTDQDRLERDLRRQAGELAASQERAHLARELHDSVTQALFSMTLTTRSVELLLERDTAAAAQKLTELRELERDALAEMRGLIFELRPGSLEQDGLVQALRTHAAAVQGRTGLSVLVEAEPIDRLPLEVEDALYRIAQEALHNVVKHASATSACIRLSAEDGSVRMTVDDDGSGFVEADVPRGHLGLAGMRSRAEQLGGRLLVSSRRGEGTVIEVCFSQRT